MLNHVSLNVRASLYLKLAEYFSFGIGSNDPALDDSEAALIIRHLIKKAATKALEDVDMSTALSEFLRDFLHNLDQHPSLRGDGLQNSLADRLAVLRKNLTEVDCHRCAQRAFLPPCCGNDKQDSLLVGRTGECFTWLLSVFTFIVTEYQKRILCMSKWQFPELHFNTSGIVATNTRLRGLTRYLSDNSSAQVIISLIIPNEINAWNLLSFAYVLAHEVVCHAYQKVGLPAAADFERPEDCPFTEGWMDATSFNLLRDFLTDPPETVPSIIQLVPDEILDSSKALFHGRYQKDFDRHVAFRENGLSVYKNFAKFVRLYSDQFSGNDLIDSGTVIIRTMARISFLINAMADDDEAENFILYCGVILGYSAGVPGYFNRCRALFEVIEPFLHHRNLARLLRELNRVATPFMSR